MAALVGKRSRWEAIADESGKLAEPEEREGDQRARKERTKPRSRPATAVMSPQQETGANSMEVAATTATFPCGRRRLNY